MAERFGLPYTVYVNMSPTIYGTGEVLLTQSEEHLRKRKVFNGCNAGHTFFHVDPHGKASICKVGRDPKHPPHQGRRRGLAPARHHRRLPHAAHRRMLRLCPIWHLLDLPPLAKLYQEAKAPLRTYCQHGERR